MPNSWFKFKQFTIEQEYAAMKVGTDGVLLGAWATVPGSGCRALDVGTGTGLIALMIAQRTRDVDMDAIEIDPASARQAAENFHNSPWKNRVHCLESSFQDYASRSSNRYDLIICNPPFFSDSLKTSSREKNLARHDDSLSLEDLLSASIPLMKSTTIISLVLPIQKESQVMELAAAHKLFCNRLCRVIPTRGKAPKRLLLEFSQVPGECIEDKLTIETGTRHSYTEEYLSLTGDFYL